MPSAESSNPSGLTVHCRLLRTIEEIPMYELIGVTKTYETKRGTVAALDGVDLRIEDGELLAVQGPTGHGKTTLLQMLGGLDRPTSGTVAFDGHELGALTETTMTDLRARNFGFVFQTFNLIPTLTA